MTGALDDVEVPVELLAQHAHGKRVHGRITTMAFPFNESIAWEAWTPAEAQRRLAPLPGLRWAVAGGWAIDLHLGRVTRPHDDLEIVVFGDDVPSVLAAFAAPDWRWDVPVEGWLHPFAADLDSHQTWLWSVAANAYVLDVFRDQHRGDTWICRRDATITRPWVDVVDRSPDDIPYLSPEIVLLFKAKYQRPKDEVDFANTLPSLDPGRRDWLRAALRQVHPDHGWMAEV